MIVCTLFFFAYSRIYQHIFLSSVYTRLMLYYWLYPRHITTEIYGKCVG